MSGSTSIVLRRLASTVPVMGIVAVVAFMLLYVTPGDPATIIAGDTASAEEVAAIRRSMGLDRPLVEQFGIWLLNVLRGDLGTSVVSGQAVTTLILQRMEPTLSLAATTILFSVLVAVPVGALAAWTAGRWPDRLLSFGAIVFFSAPIFLVGYVLIDLVALDLRWLPIQGYAPLEEGVGAWLEHLILPTLCVSFVFIALIARMTRAAVLETLGADFIRTAVAKGVPGWRVLVVHALRNASVPIAATVGLGIALLLNGVVIVENVFAIPGLGRLTVDAVLQRDFPLIRGIMLVLSLIYVLVNLAVDLSYVALDPRTHR